MKKNKNLRPLKEENHHDINQILDQCPGTELQEVFLLLQSVYREGNFDQAVKCVEELKGR